MNIPWSLPAGWSRAEARLLASALATRSCRQDRHIRAYRDAHPDLHDHEAAALTLLDAEAMTMATGAVALWRNAHANGEVEA